jgi:hypothetical protein
MPVVSRAVRKPQQSQCLQLRCGLGSAIGRGDEGAEYPGSGQAAWRRSSATPDHVCRSATNAECPMIPGAR